MQVYGSFRGQFSFGNISRAIVRALQEAKIPVTIYDIVNLNPIYEDIRAPVAMDNHAPVSILIGYPSQSSGWFQGHEHTVMVTVCETSRIPSDWASICHWMKFTVVPSAFCADAFQDSGVKNVKVIPHGIDSRLLVVGNQEGKAGAPDGAKLRFLHVSGAVSFPPRKGTPQLLYAWRRIAKRYPAHLYLKMSKIPQLLDALESLKLQDSVTILPEEQIHPSTARQFYRQFDAVIQPSRGEGFGLVPLEARSCGVPAIFTNATGHAEYFDPRVDIEVETSSWTPMKTQGNEYGMAPGVTIAAVEAGIEKFMTDIQGCKARTETWAKEQAERWIWSRVLKPLVETIRPWTTKPRLHKLGAGYRGTAW